MAPVRWIAPLRRGLMLCSIAVLCAAPAHALRVVDYNLLNYPGSTGPTRDPLYRTILAPLGVDVLVTEEQNSAAGATEFLNSLNVMEPGQWAMPAFIDGNDTDAQLYYKPAKVTFLGQWAFYPNPANQLRYVHVYRLKPVGYTSAAAELRVYAVHLKASTGSTNVAQRLAECSGIRDSLNALPAGTPVLVMGDYNFYSGTESGLLELTGSQANDNGRLYDPLGLVGVSAWQDNGAIAYAHSQSPCKVGGSACASGAATGGLDDRFDMILPTYAFNDGTGFELVSGSYAAVGNDGHHLNLNITDAPTIPEGAAYASALILASDHLPVRVDVSLPAQAQVAASLPFGTVIAGAAASQSLTVTDVATPPADALTYSYFAPAGFGAPAGSHEAPVGAPADDPIAMDTATPGAKSGDLLLSTDDPDRPSIAVALSGTVLDHASASLDSLVVTLTDTLDFGDHAAGGFAAAPVAVHDQGWSALKARLSVTGAAITGPDAARFSIVGGFTPTLVAGTAARWDVAFDDAGAAGDSTYTAMATLTFTSADEALPGGAPQPELAVALRAHVSGPVAVERVAPPEATRLYAPFPNPVRAGGTLRFDLARGGEVALEVFDLTGRRVATLARGAREPGRFSLSWAGRGDDGSTLGAGLYFVRLSAPDLVQTVRLAMVR